MCAVTRSAVQRAETVRVERTEAVHADGARVWSLLSSPAFWSLRSVTCYMFAVPDQEQLWFYLGPAPRRIGSSVFQVCEEQPGTRISLKSEQPWSQLVTLSVLPGRRGATKARIAVSRPVHIAQKLMVEHALQADLKSWLKELRSVCEGKAPWPAGTMPAELHRGCMSPPDTSSHQPVSMSVLIRASRDAVWRAVSSPRTLHSGGAVCAGIIPGTPQGQRGEMQYLIARRDDGSLRSYAVAVTDLSAGRSALTLRVGAPHEQTSYLLTDEPEGIRLHITWLGPNLRDSHDPEKSEITEFLAAAANELRTAIEDSARPDGAAPW
jgi:hypothetical protein